MGNYYIFKKMLLVIICATDSEDPSIWFCSICSFIQFCYFIVPVRMHDILLLSFSSNYYFLG
jgi:hypothetical protein